MRHVDHQLFYCYLKIEEGRDLRNVGYDVKLIYNNTGSKFQYPYLHIYMNNYYYYSNYLFL